MHVANLRNHWALCIVWNVFLIVCCATEYVVPCASYGLTCIPSRLVYDAFCFDCCALHIVRCMLWTDDVMQCIGVVRCIVCRLLHAMFVIVSTSTLYIICLVSWFVWMDFVLHLGWESCTMYCIHCAVCCVRGKMSNLSAPMNMHSVSCNVYMGKWGNCFQCLARCLWQWCYLRAVYCVSRSMCFAFVVPLCM